MKIGLFGSCQLILCSHFFINEQMKQNNNIEILFSLLFFNYDSEYQSIYHDLSGNDLNYEIFDNLDILIIEMNNLKNKASSDTIIKYCSERNIKIIKTFLLKFPIFPINCSGFGENREDYFNWIDLNSVDYVEKFKKCISSLKKQNSGSDLSMELSEFVENNFNKQLLFDHSLHPTNVLLYELWKNILKQLSIEITEYNYVFEKELLRFESWKFPFTQKMMTDLNILFETSVDDKFYINRYNSNIKRLKKQIDEKYFFAQEGPNKNLLIFLGDSITAWWDKDIYDRDFSKYENENFGIGGFLTNELIKILSYSSFLNKYKPNVIVLMIGTTNLLNGLAFDEVIRDIKIIIDIILSKFNCVKILLRGLLPCGKYKNNPIRTKIEDVNNVIMTYANGDNVFYIDNGNLFMDSEGTLDNDLMLDYMGISKEGYEVISKSITPIIYELMDK